MLSCAVDAAAYHLMLWIACTLIAAAAQTARNAMQSGLTASLGTLGATQVRFVFGLPFALVFLALAAAASQAAVPSPNARFLAFTAGGALAQIAATALLLAGMPRGSFSVATALSKTEAVQIAVFGLLILGDRLTWPRALAIASATFGVALMAIRPGARWTAASRRPALLGIAAGGGFALAAVGFRGGILALPDGGFWLRASTTLAWSLALQALLLGAWMALLAPAALLGSFRLWRQSLLAGFLGALASQFWFLGFALTAAANVRTLGRPCVQPAGNRLTRQGCLWRRASTQTNPTTKPHRPPWSDHHHPTSVGDPAATGRQPCRAGRWPRARMRLDSATAPSRRCILALQHCR